MSIGKETGRIGRMGLGNYALYRRRRLSNHVLRVVNLVAPGRRQCPCCGWRGAAFLNHVRETYWMRGAVCPRCRSHPRHRGLTLYLEALLPTLGPRPTVLHFAPERALARVFADRTKLRYVGVDIGPRAVTARADIAAIPFRDASFDLVLASHVLEHVASDAAAIADIGRVLRPGGLAVLMVPMLADWRARTTVEFGYPNPAEDGHWRIYGHDFADRITAAGLDCERAGLRSLIPAESAWRSAVADAPVFIARHPGERGVNPIPPY